LTSPGHLQIGEMETSYNSTHVEADLWLQVASPRPKSINHDTSIHKPPPMNPPIYSNRQECRDPSDAPRRNSKSISAYRGTQDLTLPKAAQTVPAYQPAEAPARLAGGSAQAGGVPDPEIERLAMEEMLQFEREQEFLPRDVSKENRGYDIESRDPQTEHLRFIEVKGRVKGAETVTVTKNEILTGLNRPDAYILAIVFVEGGAAETPVYLHRPFSQEPEFGAASVNFKLAELLTRSTDR
jgi:hypothetical protein